MSKPRLNVGKITKNSLAYSRFTDLEMFNLVHVTVASPQNAYLHFAAWILLRYLRLFFPRCYAHNTGIQRHQLRLQIPPSFKLVRLASYPWYCRAMQYTDFILQPNWLGLTQLLRARWCVLFRGYPRTNVTLLPIGIQIYQDTDKYIAKWLCRSI
jgi:hypothetical protein